MKKQNKSDLIPSNGQETGENGCWRVKRGEVPEKRKELSTGNRIEDCKQHEIPFICILSTLSVGHWKPGTE